MPTSRESQQPKTANIPGTSSILEYLYECLGSAVKYHNKISGLSLKLMMG